MTTQDVGDAVNLSHTVLNSSNAPTDATVVLTVTDPTGAITTPSVTHAGTGVYTASFTLTVAGVWYWVWGVTGTVTEVEEGQVTAVNPAPEPYVSLALLKQAVGMSATDETRDALLLRALNGASRGVEDYCDGRMPGGFYLSATATQRVFQIGRWVRHDPLYGDEVTVDDIGSTAGIVIEVSNDNTTWTALTDCEYRPDNALARQRAIRALFSPSWSFYCNRLLRVTARWGWPQVPDQVEQATLLQASRLYRRKDSPEGVAGSADWGLVRVPNLDPDVKGLLSNLKTLMVA